MFFLCVAHVIQLLHMLTYWLGKPVKKQQKYVAETEFI